MADRPPRTVSIFLVAITAMLVAALAAALLVAGLIAARRARSPVAEPGEVPQSRSRLPGGTEDDEVPPGADDIDPALIQYHQTAEIPVGLREARALAVGPGDRLYAAGDKLLRIFGDGKKTAEFPLDADPQCLAVGGAEHAVPGQIYVGMDEYVEVFDPEGRPVASWKPIEKAVITSIALSEEDVFVADAGNRVVWHYDATGKIKGRIGQPDLARKIRGFVISSHYFDIAVGPDGLLYAVNPRALHLEAFTFQGDLEFAWGKGSPAIDGFFGCCNPAHFAILPDGRFVTAEKGIPRIKIYSREGNFECVVAGPKQMAAVAADLAADSRGRVLALDATAACVRVFERKPVGPAK